MIRWAGASTLAGVGVWALVSVATAVVRSAADTDAVIFLSAFGLTVATPFLLGSYFWLRRQYLNLLMVGAAVAALLVFGVLASVPRQVGLYEMVLRWKSPWRHFLLLLASLFFLVGPFYMAGWLVRSCYRAAKGRVPNGYAKPDAITGISIPLMLSTV